jgi:hypothetical protein
VRECKLHAYGVIVSWPDEMQPCALCKSREEAVLNKQHAISAQEQLEMVGFKLESLAAGLAMQESSALNALTGLAFFIREKLRDLPLEPPPRALSSHDSAAAPKTKRSRSRRQPV